jgi:phosphoribosylformylglycinamidine cyclo-ligase
MHKDRLSYKQAGVDIDAGNEAVNLIKADVQSTHRKEVLSSLGGFAALFALDLAKYKNPVLVSGTDGVGTKLKIAFELAMHQTIGIDLVAMCVNDILVTGAEPLFFLDYLAVDKVNPQMVKEIVSGIAKGCREAGCSLIGGETAEMSGFYQKDEYDLAGFAVGVVDKNCIVDGLTISEGDLVVGLPSSGLHSNGFTLVRKILETRGILYQDYNEKLQKTWGEALLEPTRIYVKQVLPLLNVYKIKGMAHITGGGLLENLNRCLPSDLDAKLDISSWKRPLIFDMLADLGNVAAKEMFRVFNMGIGFCLVMNKAEANRLLGNQTLGATVIGEIVHGKGEVRCPDL